MNVELCNSFIQYQNAQSITVIFYRGIMKAGDIVATTGNRLIQASTISRWSHVALAIDENNVIEAISCGVVIRPLSECTKKSKSSFIFERPSKLDAEEYAKLISYAEDLKKQGLKYNWLRAGYSGLPHILKNIFIFLAAINLIGAAISFFIYGDINASYTMLLLSVISTFLGIPLSKLTGMTNQVNKWLDRINAPAWLKNNVKDQFCSQLVLDVDKKISPSFSGLVRTEHEPRPKDVVYACEKQKWKKIKI